MRCPRGMTPKLKSLFFSVAAAAAILPSAPAFADESGAAKATPVARVWVHVDGPEDVRIQEDPTGDNDWTTVCTGPCDKALPVGLQYRFVGASLRASDPFELSGEDGARLQLEVDGALKSTHTAGLILTGGGVIVAYVGVVIVYAALLESLHTDGVGGPDNSREEIFGAGLV